MTLHTMPKYLGASGGQAVSSVGTSAGGSICNIFLGLPGLLAFKSSPTYILAKTFMNLIPKLKVSMPFKTTHDKIEDNHQCPV